MKMNEGVVRVKRTCKNAKLPIRGTAGASGNGLAAVQAVVEPAHGKVLVKTGLSIAYLLVVMV